MSNLSPIRISFREELIICTTTIQVPCEVNPEGQWKKYSISCETPKQLWDTIFAIHAKGGEALAREASGANFGLASSNVIEVDFDYIQAAVRRFLGKGHTVKRIPAGESAFSTSKVDIDSILSELDKIPDLISAELRATDSAEVTHEVLTDEETDVPSSKVA